MAEEIRPSLYRIVVPLPGSPLKEINSYVVTARDRNLIFDTGMNRPECMEAMMNGLDEIGVDLERTDFIATHLHADHHGLIPELLREGRKAYMGEIDAQSMKQEFSWAKASPMGEYLARSGFPADELEASFRNHPAFRFRSQKRVDYLPLKEGDVVEIGDYRFETVDTPGHTFGHVSFYEPHKKIFLAGDHVLGDITPNIQAWSDDHDPLEEYLSSLTKVEDLEVEICLPGHRSLVERFRDRVDELQEHHRERANEAIDVLEEGPKNAYETAAGMTRAIRAKSWEDFPLMQRWFATGETIAHLRYLEEKGMIARQENEEIVYSSGGAARL